VAACARTLAGALLGGPSPAAGVVSPRAAMPGVPRALDAVLVAAQDGTITTAAELAAVLDALDLEDDAQPAVVAERTPPVGIRVVPPPVRIPGSRTGAAAGVVVGLLLAAAIGVAAFVLSNRSSPSPTGGGGSAGTTLPGGHGGELAVTDARAFDPFGDRAEQDQLLGNLHDGNPSTIWSTEEYRSPTFGGLKPGVGVVVVLDGSHTLHQLTVTSPSRGWAFSVYAGAQPAADLAGWGSPVAQVSSVNADITPVDLHGASGGAVLVWITNLGPPLAHPPQPGTPYRVDVGELQVR
jgi:hypothetical protein